MTRNQYALPRDIPSDVKREVRQRCGYGCVICGCAIVEYEHFRPEFAKARHHTAAGIVLLCPLCHSMKTRNHLSRQRIAEAQPAAKRSGFAFSQLEASANRPYVRFAGSLLRNCRTPVQVGSWPVLRIEPAEEEGGPYRLSASFFDSTGRPSLLITENEWRVLADAWDVEVTGATIVVRTAKGEIALRLVLDPGQGVIVDRLNMYCNGMHLIGGAESLDVKGPHVQHSFRGNIVDNCAIGLAL